MRWLEAVCTVEPEKRQKSEFKLARTRHVGAWFSRKAPKDQPLRYISCQD